MTCCGALTHVYADAGKREHEPTCEHYAPQYICFWCDQPIVSEDPHTDDETGEDVHQAHCTKCHPENFEFNDIGAPYSLRT